MAIIVFVARDWKQFTTVYFFKGTYERTLIFLFNNELLNHEQMRRNWHICPSTSSQTETLTCYMAVMIGSPRTDTTRMI